MCERERERERERQRETETETETETERRGWFFLIHFSPYFLRQGLSQNLILTSWLTGWPMGSRDLPISVSPALELPCLAS